MNSLRNNKKLQNIGSIADYEFIVDQSNVAIILETQDIVEIIEQLKPPYDLIFKMVVDGYKEIREILKINDVTCRSYYMRNRKMLIQLFQQHKNYHENDVK